VACRKGLEGMPITDQQNMRGDMEKLHWKKSFNRCAMISL
jgi:hypothetical protein